MSEQEKKAVQEPKGIVTGAKPVSKQFPQGNNSHLSAECKEKVAKGNPQANPDAVGGVPL